MIEWGDPTGVGLNLEQFAWAMKRGLGRAVLHAQGGLNEAELGILRSWYTESPAYDRQVEDSRADHVYAAAEAAGDLERLRTDLARYLECEDHPKEEADSWYPDSLAGLLLEQGDAGMESILMRSMKRGAERGLFCGACDLVIYGGEAMLLRVASIIGPHLNAKNLWWTDMLLNRAARGPVEDYAAEHERLQDMLRIAAVEDPGVAAFLRAVEEDKKPKQVTERKEAGETFEELLLAIAEITPIANPFLYGKARYCVVRWARKAATEEYDKAVAWITTTQDPIEFKALTYLFDGERPYPGPIDVMVRRALDEQDPCQASVPYVLAYCDGEEIAEAARELMQRGRFDPWVIQMFSARENDDDDATYMLEQLQGREWESDKDLHDVSLGVRTLCDSTESDAWGPVAEWVYETTPCSFCRGGVFEYLAEEGLLTHERALEGVHDSDSRVRKIAKEFLGMPPDDDE